MTDDFLILNDGFRPAAACRMLWACAASVPAKLRSASRGPMDLGHLRTAWLRPQLRSLVSHMGRTTFYHADL
jgi:hypothetical protein